MDKENLDARKSAALSNLISARENIAEAKEALEAAMANQRRAVAAGRAAGLSLKDMADAMHVTRSMVSKILHNER